METASNAPGPRNSANPAPRKKKAYAGNPHYIGLFNQHVSDHFSPDHHDPLDSQCKAARHQVRHARLQASKVSSSRAYYIPKAVYTSRDGQSLSQRERQFCLENPEYQALPGTFWTSEEKNRFFNCLARYSIHRVEDIAQHLPRKSTFEVTAYYSLLKKDLSLHKRRRRLWATTEDGREAPVVLSYAQRGVPYSCLPIAKEMDDAWDQFEELQSVIAAEQAQVDSSHLASHREKEFKQITHSSDLLVNNEGAKALGRLYRANTVVPTLCGKKATKLTFESMVFLEEYIRLKTRELIAEVILGKGPCTDTYLAPGAGTDVESGDPVQSGDSTRSEDPVGLEDPSEPEDHAESDESVDSDPVESDDPVMSKVPVKSKDPAESDDPVESASETESAPESELQAESQLPFKSRFGPVTEALANSNKTMRVAKTAADGNISEANTSAETSTASSIQTQTQKNAKKKTHHELVGAQHKDAHRNVRRYEVWSAAERLNMYQTPVAGFMSRYRDGKTAILDHYWQNVLRSLRPATVTQVSLYPPKAENYFFERQVKDYEPLDSFAYQDPQDFDDADTAAEDELNKASLKRPAQDSDFEDELISAENDYLEALDAYESMLYVRALKTRMGLCEEPGLASQQLSELQDMGERTGQNQAIGVAWDKAYADY